MRESVAAVMQQIGCALIRVVTLAAVLWLASCATDPTERLERAKERAQELAQERKIFEVARKLDKVERSAEEWGRATVSDLALVDNTLAPGSSNGFFALQFNQPTEFYMSNAAGSVQGTASLAISEQTSTAFSATFNPLATKLPTAVARHDIRGRFFQDE